MSRKVTAAKPAGGFALIGVEQLFLAWSCYAQGIIRLFDLRVWFALHELKSRRCNMKRGRKPEFSIAEIMELTGQSRRTAVRSAVRRLDESGTGHV